MTAYLHRVIVAAGAGFSLSLAGTAFAQTAPAAPPPVHHHHYHGSRASDDALTAELNRQELATVSNAAMPVATAGNATQINSAHQIEPYGYVPPQE